MATAMAMCAEAAVLEVPATAVARSATRSVIVRRAAEAAVEAALATVVVRWVTRSETVRRAMDVAAASIVVPSGTTKPTVRSRRNLAVEATIARASIVAILGKFHLNGSYVTKINIHRHTKAMCDQPSKPREGGGGGGTCFNCFQDGHRKSEWYVYLTSLIKTLLIILARTSAS
jgi:hypothetical protein